MVFGLRIGARSCEGIPAPGQAHHIPVSWCLIKYRSNFCSVKLPLPSSARMYSLLCTLVVEAAAALSAASTGAQGRAGGWDATHRLQHPSGLRLRGEEGSVFRPPPSAPSHAHHSPLHCRTSCQTEGARQAPSWLRKEGARLSRRGHAGNEKQPCDR